MIWREDAVDHHLAADHGTIAAESLLPPALHQNHRRRAAGRIVFLRKPASQLRLDTEHRQDFRSHIEILRFFRLGESPDLPGRSSVQANALERSPLFAIGEIKKRRRVGIGKVHARSRVIQINQLIRVVIRQRLQKNAIDHAKDRAVRPDADSQREHAYGRETGIVSQATSGVSQSETHAETTFSHP